MFAAEMLRHFAAEIWNSLCNLSFSSSYKTWKCCKNLKFTIPRFRRRFCFFLVCSCKDCWRFLSLLLGFSFFFYLSWHLYNKSAISNLYLLWIGSSVYWPQDLKSIPFTMYDWWSLMFNKKVQNNVLINVRIMATISTPSLFLFFQILHFWLLPETIKEVQFWNWTATAIWNVVE